MTQLQASNSLASEAGVWRLLVTSMTDNRVFRFNGVSGALIDSFDPKNVGDLSLPTGICDGPRGKGEILVANFHGEPSLNRYDASTGRYIGGIVQNAVGAIGIARGYEDDLYLASERSGSVLRCSVTGTGEFVGDVTARVPGAGIQGIVFLPAEGPGSEAAMYVTYSRINQVLKYPMGTVSAIDEPPYTGSTVLSRATNVPIGITFGPNRLLYVANSGSNNVVRCHRNGGPLDEVFVAADAGGLRSPWGIVFGPDGDLYVASHDTNQILRFHGPSSSAGGTFRDVFVAKVEKPAFLKFVQA